MLSKQTKQRIAFRKALRRHPKKRWVELNRRAQIPPLNSGWVLAIKHMEPGEEQDNAFAALNDATAERAGWIAADIRYYGRDRITAKYQKQKAVAKVKALLDLTKMTVTPEQAAKWLDTLPASLRTQKAPLELETVQVMTPEERGALRAHILNDDVKWMYPNVIKLPESR